MEPEPSTTQEASAPTAEQFLSMVNQLQEQLAATQNQLLAAQNQINNINSAHSANPDPLLASSSVAPQPQKPSSFNGKGSVESWVAHMDNYVAAVGESTALQIAVTYLSGDAHEWWMVQSRSITPTPTRWPDLRAAVLSRYSPLNKTKIARDKLSRWKQLKDVESYSRDFLRIILEIPNISMDEQIDRFARGLKPQIWRELCTTDYTDLAHLMRDAERVEAAFRNDTRAYRNFGNNNFGNSSSTPAPVPMELGSMRLGKLTPEERERCFKEGLCLRCRQPGHVAKDCPKNPPRN
jgi:hypothetical protein